MIKNKILTYFEKSIKKQYSSYSKEQIEIIMYGIEGLYITITKCIIIFSIAAILGLFKELIILLVFFNIIRITAFGMHAPNGLICLIISSLIFILGSYLTKVLIIDKTWFCIIYPIYLLLIAVFAPADTKKRPLINKKKRKIYKILSCLIVITFFAISIIINNNIIVNAMAIALLIEIMLIIPTTYKLFKLPYRNYKNYGLSNY